MDKKHSNTASPTTLTRVLAVGVCACIGGGLVALLAGASAQIVTVALVTGAATAVGAAIFEYLRAPDTFRTTARSPFDAAPGDLLPAPLPEEGERWVEIDAAHATRVKRIMWMAYALPFLLLLPWVWARHDITDPSLPVGTRALGRLQELMTVVVVLICAAAIIFLHQQVKRALRIRIGAHRTHLLYDPGTGKIERYEWSSVLTDKFQLLIGRRIVALVPPMFPAENLRALILARVPATSFVGHARFQLNALRRGNLPLWAIVAGLCGMAVLLLLGEWHPEWFKAVLEALMTWLRASAS
jgi:hypothetical protein